MACNISKDVAFVCEDKQKMIGGFKPNFWIFNTGDVVSYTTNVAGYVTGIVLKSTKQIYTYEALKDTLTATAGMGKVEGSGIGLFNHSISFKGIDVTPAQRAAFEDLANAESLGAILETTAGQFEIFGKDFGMKLGDANEKSYGLNPTEDTSRNVSLASAGELGLPKIFLDTDRATTLADIIALETPQP